MTDIRFGAPTPEVEADGARRIEVPPARYTSAEFMELERRHLWPKVWLVAGFVRDLARPGDYFVYEHGHESILVARDESGAVGAFHNVCLHRGHLLRDPGRGHCEAFVCPYHAWQWGLDGALRTVPHRARFPQGFPADRRRLAPVACEVWAGMVWVCLGEPRESLAEYLGPIHEHVSRYRAEDFRINDDWTAEWACNWKTALDGFNETYHGPATHPQFAEFIDTIRATFQFGEQHSVFVIKHGVPPPSASDEVRGPLADTLRRAGADPADFRGRPDAMRAVVQAWVRAQSTLGGHDLSALTDEQLTDTHHFYVFPNAHIDFHGANDLTLQRFRPHPTDPERFFMDVVDLKRLKGEYSEARGEHRNIPLGAPQRGVVYAQDVERLTRVQRGMRSRGFRGAHLSQMERRIYHMHLTIDAHLGDHCPAALRTTVSDPLLSGIVG